MNENTLHADAHHDDPQTAVVDMPTRAAEALAWSLADTTPDVTPPPPEDGRPLSRILAGLLIVVGVVGLSLTAFILGRHDGGDGLNPYQSTETSSPAPAPSPSSPPPVAATPPAAPPPSASVTAPAAPRRSGPDEAFLAAMHADGIPYRSGDTDAIVSAHQVCNSLADGGTLGDEARTIQRALGWSFTHASDFVSDAVGAYCPQNAR